MEFGASFGTLFGLLLLTDQFLVKQAAIFDAQYFILIFHRLASASASACSISRDMGLGLQSLKQHACVRFFRRNGYITIFVIFGILVLSQLKHLLNISKFINNIPLDNVYLGISNNTTIDIQDSRGDIDGAVFIVVGGGVISLRAYCSMTSHVVAHLPSGTVLSTSSRLEHFNTQSLPECISVSQPAKGWLVGATPGQLTPARKLLPSCNPDSFLPGVKYAMKASAAPDSAHRASSRRNSPLPPPSFGEEWSPSDFKMEKFVTVDNISDCCHACARTALCAGWTFLNGMCLFREGGMPYKVITGVNGFLEQQDHYLLMCFHECQV